ncbi:BIO1 [Auxenochlorella protothecoides x Auxenochlorella symbiontica]
MRSLSIPLTRCSRLFTRRFLSSERDDGHISLGFPTLCIWGANTGVGKTLVSAGLAAAVTRAEGSLLYLKPLQTGFPTDSDARTVAAACGGATAVGPHAARLLPPGAPPHSAPASSASRLAKTLYAWAPAVGPHAAAAAEAADAALTPPAPPADPEVLAAVATELAAFEERGLFLRGDCMALVESAGGVASPSPAGGAQCDLLAPLRAPALLVGDGRLGGISVTYAAYELLRGRGHAVPFLLLAEEQAGNADALARLIGPGETQILALPPLPAPAPARDAAAEGGRAEAAAVPAYLEPPCADAGLADWLSRTALVFDRLRVDVAEEHARRVRRLQSLEETARRRVWWPFHQHARADSPVAVFDARAGERLLTLGPAECTPSLVPLYDACASWWTQGLNAAGQVAVGRAAAAAAARYGHVIFSGTVHEPALQLAEAMLDSVGQGWASRAFFSDDGSTAVEVALKMAFRKFLADRGATDWEVDDGPELGVLGLQGAYHGDTLGAMDCVAPSPFNGRRQTPWYAGRGLFLDPPTLALRGGAWVGAGLPAPLPDLAAVFAPRPEAVAAHRAAIAAALDAHDAAAGARLAARPAPPALAACLLEPVVQGSGGMRLVDPAFQRALAAEARARGIPLVLDEVFTGLWRLGAPSGAALLGLDPDVACYGKLLTGGLVPLALTLASEPVFEAFKGESKLDALLHGHSYTAHPTGCAAALAALAAYASPALNPNAGALAGAAARRLPLTLWGEAAAAELSRLPGVAGVTTLGTLLAVELGGAGGGYASDAAAGVVAALRRHGVFARPLGPVVYLMVTPMTEAGEVDRLLAAMKLALADVGAGAGPC